MPTLIRWEELAQLERSMIESLGRLNKKISNMRDALETGNHSESWGSLTTRFDRLVVVRSKRAGSLRAIQQMLKITEGWSHA